MVTVKNATPHPLSVYAEADTQMIDDGRGGLARVPRDGAEPLYTIPMSGAVARLESEDRGVVGQTDQLTEVREAVFGELVGMPSPEPGVLWAVSMPCAPAALAAGRRDFVLMYDQVRVVSDGRPGAVCGCLAFSRPPVA